MKPTVLHLIDSFRQGGSEQQAVQLARLLKESGRYDVRVACLSSEGPLRDEMERSGFAEIPEYRLNNFYDLNALRQLQRFVRHLKNLKVDILHTHDFYTNIFGMAAARIARVPLRLASRRESGKRSRSKRALERAAYLSAHRIIANCDEVRRQLIAEGVRGEKIITLYNGLSLKRFTPGLRSNREAALAGLGLPLEANLRFVTIVANLREVKDHPTFLRAARRVKAEIADAAFVLAGEGSSEAELRALASKLDLGSAVHFIGRCERVAELLAISSVCVLSSKSEGFSNSILEYMAAGRAVVATDVGGAREAIIEGESGFLAQPGDDRLMAERIITLLKDGELAKRMGARARAIIEQRFSSERRLELTEMLYDELLINSSRPVPHILMSGKGESA
ncbi:MAG TPA: glycosyltransferase [Blastocatellia bacterium]